MATEGGSAAKGKKAGKRSNPSSAGSEPTRVFKQEPTEVEESVITSPPTKKRRNAATAALAAVAATVASEQKEPKSNTHSSQLSKSRGSITRNQTPQHGKATNKQVIASPSTQVASTQSNIQKNSVKSNPGDEWNNEDLVKLIENLVALLPKTDSVKYSTQVDRVDWAKVSFANHTPEECKDKWSTIMTKLRRYRTLTELAQDAKEWVKHPWMTYNNSKGKPKHPDLPKKPLTPYFRYFLEKREKYSQDHPEMSMTELAKLLAKKFAELPEKKKQKYKESYEKENEIYKSQMEKFKEEHPDMFPEMEVKNRPQNKQNGPQKPQTPLQLFLADKMNKHLDETGSNRKELEEKYRAQWRNLTDSKRVRWIKKAMADEQRFETELAEYCLLHPEFKPDQVKSVISKAEKGIKDRSDGKPERPPNSGYSLYSKIMLKELKDIPSKEKMSEISRRWKELSDKERQSYAKKATEAMERYQHEYKLYVASLSEEDRKKLEEETKKKKKPANSQATLGVTSQVPKQNARENIETTPSRPKKPMSALFFYQQEKLAQYKAKHPDKSEQELTRLIAREYGELSEKKKEKYKKMAEEAKKSYEQTTSSKENEVKNKAFKGEPKKPPQSGYSLFTSELMSKLTEIEPKFRMAEISKQWGALTNNEKEKYKRRATDLQKKYSKELQKFLATLTEEEKKVYQQMKAKKPIRRKTAAAKTVAAEESSSSSESSKEENKEDSSSSESESGSESGSSDSEESESDSGSGSDSESKSEASESGKDSDDEDNDKDDKDDSGNSSSAESESQSGSGSASESESE